MYLTDQLDRIHRDLEYYSGLNLPSPPPIGPFDIKEVYDAEYFFG